MKSYIAKPDEVKRQWYLFNAENKTLGRFASQVARVLIGKDKPTWTPHVDAGDFAIIINAKKIRVTGKKMTNEIYYRHSGYPGGLKKTTLKEMFAKHPERILYLAIKRMLPKNRLQAKRIKRLFIYPDSEHPHQAQKPIMVG